MSEIMSLSLDACELSPRDWFNVSQKVLSRYGSKLKSVDDFENLFLFGGFKYQRDPVSALALVGEIIASAAASVLEPFVDLQFAIFEATVDFRYRLFHFYLIALDRETKRCLTCNDDAVALFVSLSGNESYDDYNRILSRIVQHILRNLKSDS